MNQQTEQILQMLSQPVFLAKNGVVQWCNSAAMELHILQRRLSDILDENSLSYQLADEWQQIDLEVKVFGVPFVARISLMDGMELFMLERKREDSPTAVRDFRRNLWRLRRSLEALSLSGDQMQDQLLDMGEDPLGCESMNRAIFQLTSVCARLTDQDLLESHGLIPRYEKVCLSDFVEDFVTEASDILDENGWELRSQPCKINTHVYMDASILRRCFYRVIGEIMEKSGKEQFVQFTVYEEGGQICFGFSGSKPRDREPFADLCDWDMDRESLHTANMIARLHGGIFLTIRGEDLRNRRFLFAMKRNAICGANNPNMSLDPYPGRHPGLVELAHVLDKKFYHPDRI